MYNMITHLADVTKLSKVVLFKKKKFFFKRQPPKMVKHTQTIRRQQPTNCLRAFGHFVGLVLKALIVHDLQLEF